MQSTWNSTWHILSAVLVFINCICQRTGIGLPFKQRWAVTFQMEVWQETEQSMHWDIGLRMVRGGGGSWNNIVEDLECQGLAFWNLLNMWMKWTQSSRICQLMCLKPEPKPVSRQVSTSPYPRTRQQSSCLSGMELKLGLPGLSTHAWLDPLGEGCSGAVMGS
jgi:hypothetical protein